MTDFPFAEAAYKARQLERQGFEVYQKFTCIGCGNRLTMSKPNVFHESGTCDKCPAVTDIKRQGCNYMAVISRGARRKSG